MIAYDQGAAEKELLTASGALNEILRLVQAEASEPVSRDYRKRDG
jgi:hypothetical protein